MSRVKVKLDAEDESYPLMRRLTLNSGATHIRTPVRALHLKQDKYSESRLVQHDSARGLNEIYHILTKQKIDNIDNDVDKLNEWGRGLNRLFAMPKVKNELNLLYFKYENKNRNKPNTLPTDAEIEYLCNITSHPTSEIIIPPMIPGISGEDYLKFLKKFFEFLKSYKKGQTVMGNIPTVSTSELKEINQFYFEEGINLFSVDFNGRYPIDSYILVNEIRRLSNKIREEYKNETYLHAFNITAPRPRQTTDVAPAKDILTLASGFDSYGASHKGMYIPKEKAAEIKEKKKQKRLEAESKNIPYVSTFRLFNRKDYGYYRNDASGVNEIFEDSERSTIKQSDLIDHTSSNTKRKGFQRAFNAEKQALEALKYHVHIEESSVAEYVREKEHGRDNFNLIEKRIK